MIAELTLFTSIQKELLKKHLLKGSLYAILGSLVLVSMGAFASLDFLESWGFIIAIIGFGLIALGLIPYRKLTRLASTPNSIKISKEGVTYVDRSHQMFFLPLKSIDNVHFVQKNQSYGIGIQLKKDRSEKVHILNPRFRPRSFLISSAKHENSDLFLPYFPKEASKELQEVLWESK